MKTQFLKLFTLSFAFVIVSAFSATTALAQYGAPLKVEIPFNFYVGNERFTAGKYEVKRLGTNSFQIQNQAGNAEILAQATIVLGENKSIENAKLIFNRYGNKYFLRQIFTARFLEGRGLYESKTEKTLRRGLKNDNETAIKTKAEQIAVLMETN